MTNTLTRKYNFLVMEDLNVVAMMAGPAHTGDECNFLGFDGGKTLWQKASVSPTLSPVRHMMSAAIRARRSPRAARESRSRLTCCGFQ